MTTRILSLCVVAALSASIASAQSHGRSDIPPLSFEPNLGQTASSVAYLVQEPSRQVFLNAQSITYSIPSPSTGATAPGSAHRPLQLGRQCDGRRVHAG